MAPAPADVLVHNDPTSSTTVQGMWGVWQQHGGHGSAPSPPSGRSSSSSSSMLSSPGGGAQRYAEKIRAAHLKEGAPSHPIHATRPNVRHGEVGTATFTVNNAHGVGAAANPAASATTTTAAAAAASAAQNFTHFFEACVGSGHMSLTLREDWRTHVRMASRDLGVQRIRGHGLLDDDMSVSYSRGQNSFYNIDSLIDFLGSVQMRPLFELSFMPGWLASDTHTVCHYKGRSDPPKNFSDWGAIIGALGQHIVSKYGEEVASEIYSEVWNEPNDAFWQGNQSQYFELYKQAALALKAASPNLKVGGPATCCADCWMSDFIEHMRQEKVPVDFISTHAYSSCSMAGLGDVSKVSQALTHGRDTLNEAYNNTNTSYHYYYNNNNNNNNNSNNNNKKKKINNDNYSSGSIFGANGGGGAPVATPPWLVTEFGSSCNQGFGNKGGPQFPSAIHDMIDQSSYTIAAVDAVAGPGEPQALSYWVGSVCAYVCVRVCACVCACVCCHMCSFFFVCVCVFTGLAYTSVHYP